MKSPILSKAASPSTSGVVFASLCSNYTSAWVATESQMSGPISVDGSGGTLSNWWLKITTNPGVGKSWDFTVYKNGVATAMTINISGTNVFGSDTSNTVTYAAGDTLSICSTPTGSPTAAGIMSWCIDADQTGQPILTGSGNGATNTAVTTYLSLQGSSHGISSTLPSVIPTPGTISKMYLTSATASGAAKSYTVTLVKNGVDTALTTSVSGAGSGSGITFNSDLSNSVSVAAGDTVYWKIVPTSIPAATRMHVGVLFTPTTDGESIQSMITTQNAANSGNNYQGIGGGALAFATSESTRANYFNSTIYDLKRLYVILSFAPGGAASYTATLRHDGANTAVTTTISGSNLTGNDTTHTGVTLGAGRHTSVNLVGASTPATATAAWSYVTYMAVGGSETVTPGVATLALTPFAPTVSVSDNQVATPGLASLSLAAFAPTVSVTDNVTVTPDTATLGTTSFAPSVTTTDHQLVTPATASLTLTTFVPTVTATDTQLVTPGVLALTTTLFAPTVTATDTKTVTPDPAALSLTTFTPAVTATDNKTVTPSTASLTTSLFAPTVTAYDNKTVTPSTGALTLTTFTPSVVLNHRVIPATASLTITTFAPVPAVSDNITAIPGTSSLTTTTYAPTVRVPVTVTPGVASLSTTLFAPTLSITDNKRAVPDTASLSLTPFAPSVLTPELLIPGTAALSLTPFTPVVTATFISPEVIPDTAQLTLATYQPDVYTSVRSRKYYIDSDGNIYWVVNQNLALVEPV